LSKFNKTPAWAETIKYNNKYKAEAIIFNSKFLAEAIVFNNKFIAEAAIVITWGSRTLN